MAFALTVVLTVPGCIAAIPVAIVYYEDSLKYVAKAELPVPAEKVYSTAVSLAQKKETQMKEAKIEKKDDANRMIEMTDGKETVSLKVNPIGSDKSEIIVTSNVPKAKDRKEEEKLLAFRVIDTLCSELDVKYTLVKK